MTSFDKHWEAAETNDIPLEKSIRAESFLKPFFQKLNSRGEASSKMRLLDAGCGDGVHAVEIYKTVDCVNYYGIDISENAIDISKKRIKSDNFHFTRADIADIGYQSNYFDAVISYGVIAYTDDPLKTLKELYRVTSPGGLIGIWIKTENNLLQKKIFTFLRKICQKSDLTAHTIASLIIPFMKYLPVDSGVNLSNSSWSQCKEVVLVNIAPEQLIIPSNNEVLSWVNTLKVEIIKQTNDSGLELWLRKL